MREIFEYFKAIVHENDLLDFATGKFYKENLINVYFKILEKMNLVIQSSYNYQKQSRGSQDPYN